MKLFALRIDTSQIPLAIVSVIVVSAHTGMLPSW